jgi:cellulose biosynthesis protein BcsQ
MGEDFATEFYWSSDSNNQVSTIRDILQPIEDGDSHIQDNIKPILSSKNRFNVDLIPGHPSFSIIEDRLGAAWHDLLGGDTGGIRKTNWNTSLCNYIKKDYDFVFYDLGPSLGSINRSVLIGCDKFITPMGSDIFSLLGIRNIGNWINHWLDLYKNSIDLAESRNPGRLQEYPIMTDPRIRNGYLGYTMQQYISTRSIQGVKRPTRAYEKIISNVPEIVVESLGSFFGKNITPEIASLGDVPHLFSLIPRAQSVASPILDLQRSDGLVGSQYKQKENYDKIIKSICSKILKNISLESS